MDLVQMGHLRERPSREDLRLTRAGRKQLQKEEAQWLRASIVELFLEISENPS